jgi:7-cyano-7-deazaguanine synthase
VSKKAVVLLSGGIDSATALTVAINGGFAVYALTFRYGQRHAVEIELAMKVAHSLGVTQHRVLTVEMLGGSSLTGEGDIPKGRAPYDMASGIPSTYVPARNTIFLAHALGWAEVIGAADIFMGVNAVDYSGYADCRPEYVEAFEKMANLATKAGVEGALRFTIHAPLIRMSKEEIVRLGLSLGLDYGMTSSCYDPSEDGACGGCDACVIRLNAFAANGMADPIRYWG